MDKEKIRALQLVQLTIMDDIHRVCTNNGLKYYMIGGTMLGAVRHGGFIPWDVDIDIAMPRNDYEQFVNVFSRQLNPNFSCHYYKTDKNFSVPHAIVVLNNSTIEYSIDKINPQIKRMGIYVDILPLDLCPNEKKLRKKQELSIARIRKIMYFKTYFNYYTDNQLTKWAKKIVRLILSVIPMRFLHNRLNKVMTKYNDQEGKDICSMVSHYGYDKLSMAKEIFGEPVGVMFEGRTFFAPHDYLTYLKKIFSDYMKLPSPETRQKQMDNLVSATWPNNIIEETITSE